MKILVLLAANLLIGAAAYAHNDTVCGHLASRTVGPKCEPGRMCPHYMRLEFFIANGGVEVILEAKSEDILQKIETLKNEASDKRVCAVGERDQNGSLSVEQIYVDSRSSAD